MAKSDDILKKYGITQVKGSENGTGTTGGNSSSSGSTGTGIKKADDILSKYGITQVRPSSFGTAKEWSDAGTSLLSEIQQSFSKWRKSNDDEQNKLQAKINSYISQAERWRSLYSDDDEVVSYIDSVVSALSKASSYASQNHKYYSQWDTEDAYIKGAGENREQRQQIYEGNKKRIEEIDSELPWYGKTFLPSSVEKWFLSDDKDALMDEREALVAENLMYERGEGGWTSKVSDDYYKVTQAPNFETGSANRNHGNPTKDELTKYDALVDSSTWYYDENDVLRDAFGNEIVKDASGNLVNPLAQDYTVTDRLGLFLSATERDIEEYSGTIVSGTWGNIIGEGLDGSWNQLSKDEIDIYYYLLNTSGQETADKYLADMKTELNRRQTLAGIEQWNASYDEANLLEKIALNAATVPVKFLSNITGSVENAAHTLRGESINPYSFANSGMHFSSTVRGNTAEELDATGFKVPLLDKIGIDFTLGDIYQTGISRIDSALATSVFGGGGAVFLGMGAAQEEAYKLYKQGASEEQITIGAFAAGAAEAFFEKLSYGKLKEIEKVGSPFEWVKSVLVQGYNELYEEAATEVSNIISNALVMGSQSDLAELYKDNKESAKKTFKDILSQVAHSAFGGFLGGAAAGIGQSTSVYVDTTAKYRNAGSAIMSADGGVVELKNLANEIAGVSEGKMKDTLTKQAGKVSDQVATGEGIRMIGAAIKNSSNATKVGRLYNTVQTANNLANASANQADIAKSLQRKGFNADTAKDIAAALVAQYNGQELDKAQVKLLESVENSQYVKKAISDIMDNAKSTMGQRSDNIRNFNRDVAVGSIAKAYGISADKARMIAEGKMPADEESLPDSHYEVSADGKTIDKDGNIVTIQGIASLENGRMVLQTENGTVDAKDVSYASQSEALVYEAVANLEGIIDTDTANKLSKHLMKLGDVSSDVYAKGIVQAYTDGYYGYGRDAMTGENTLSATLSEKQRNVAYGLGEQYRNAKTDADQANAATATVQKTAQTGKSTAPDGTQYQKVRFEGKMKKWGKKQKAEVAYIDFIASNFSGNTVRVFESYKAKDGKYYYEDSNGKIQAAPNGMYIDSTGDIYLDLNAGNHGEGLVMNTFAHELYHHIQRRSPEKARKLAEFLVQELGYESVEAAVRRQIAKATAAGHGVAHFMEKGMSRSAAERLVYDRAFNDFVADSLETMFTEGDAIGKLQKLKSQDEGLFNMIKDFINKWVKKLREFYRSHSTISIEGDLVRQLDKFEQIQQMFVEALVDAGDNFKSLATMEENTDAVPVEEVTEYSYRSLAEAAGFEAVENADGTRSFLRNGVKVSEVTVDDIENSPIGAMINYSLEKKDISAADAKRQKQMFADICTMACKTNDFSMTMQFVGSAVFTGMKANADKQYGTTYDFPSICTKTQAVIDAMSKRMVKLGRGLSSEELVKLYQDVFASGNPVPCPECYVFSRWIGIGGLLDNIKKYQDYYGGMAVEDVAKAYRTMRDEVAAFAEEQGISFGKAKGALTSKLTKEYNKLTEKIEKAQNQGEKVKPADQKRLAELEPMMNTVKGMTWLENVYFADSSLKKVNPRFRVPDSVLFDLNNGEAFATQYKEAWAFRTTQGAGYGKAITPYAEARLGEGILVTNNTTNAIKGKAQGSLDNFFLRQKGTLDKKAREALDRARLKQKIQAFIGGQRFQSTSDARYENASDYLLAALEMQAMHGMVQVYTKVDGAVPALANWNYSINQSLMPLGGGLDANGNVKDTSVGGMNRDIAFRNREKFETAGTITIGVNDNHIRAMFQQWVRDFIIPYHASGGKADVVAEFRRIQEGQEKRGQMVRSTDYSRTQGDKVLSDEVLRWQGKTDAEIQRIHAVREARIAILTSGKPNMDVVRSNRFLSALYDKLNGGEWDKVKLAKSKVESQIYPNEFWDQTVSYDDSGKITRDYLEYCNDLGFLHRFSGLVPSNGKLVPVKGYDQNGERVELTDLAYKYDEDGQKTDQIEEYFWKVLTDRRMYDNQGKYLPQKVVTLNDTTPDTVTTFAKGNYGRQYDKELSMKTAKEIAGKMYSDRVSDKETLAFLNEQLRNGEVTKVYRAMQVQPVDEDGNVIKATVVRVVSQSPLMVEAKTFGKNGKVDVYPAKLFSPMAGVVDGKWSKNIELNAWEVTTYDLANAYTVIDEKTGKPKIDNDKKNASYGEVAYFYGLVKGGIDDSGKALTPVPARYNPYIHTSLSALNDQFSSAHKRPELVTVECLVPNSELTSGERAEGAKDRVGAMSWHSGPTSSRLAKVGKARTVILTRYDMPVRVLPDSEVAKAVAEYIGDTENIAIKGSTVTPSLSRELMNLGISVLNEEQWSQYDKDFPTKTFGKKKKAPKETVLYSDRVIMGSLFSGGGTLEAGLAYQMLDKQFGVEYDGKIASVYADNHGDHIQVGRVEDFDISKHKDIFYLHASPVCHNFSAAKHGAKELQMDIDSAKATAKHLETAMPQVFTVENAPGYRKSESLKIITNKLTELGYKWDVDVYNSADYGSATSRNRVILRAVKDGELPPKPSKQARTNSWDKVTRDLWDTLPKATLRPSFVSAIENTTNLPILDDNGKVNVNKPLLILTTTSGHTVTFCWEGEICPTLTTKCGEARLIMPDGNIYAVTPEFMGRIQGLPDDYKYPKEKTRAFTIIGNGIPTHLTKAVVGGVLDSAYEQTHDGQVLYSDRISELTEDEVHRLIENSNHGKYALDTFIPVRRDTPPLLVALSKKDGLPPVKNLPIIMNVEHIQQCMDEEVAANDGKRGHALTSDNIIEIIKGLDNPRYVFFQKDNKRYCEVVEYDVGNRGEKALAIVTYTGNKNQDLMNGFPGREYNILVTAYPPDAKYWRDYQKSSNNVLIYDKTKDAPQGSYGSHVPSLLSGSPFATKVTYPGEEVKNYSDREFPANAEEVAKEYFGTTRKWSETGWLLRDGTQLDFSGRHWERDPENEIDLGEAYYSGKRNMEHYEIAEAFPGLREFSHMEYRGEHLDRFMNRGNIRIVGKGIVAIEKMPTEEQFEKLRSYFRENIDRGMVVGIGRDGLNFNAGTNPSIIIEGIRDYFSHNRRSQSDLMRFHTLYQDRDTESVSNRSLLANAFEGVAKDDFERNKIREYKGQINLINAEERKLSELNEKIKELSFAKGPKDTKAIRDLQFEARQTANRINTYDKILLRLEASKPLQDVLAREKKLAYQKAEKQGKEALAAYKERAAKTQRELMDRWQESRKKGIENREKTFMRHKIQSVVGELNQLLLSNDKKRHVPDSLKKAVADALALVNMDTVGAEERAAKYAALIAKETDPDKIDAYTVTMENILRQGDKMGQRLKELRDAYEEIQDSDDPDIANAYDPVIAGSLKELAGSIGNTSLRNMTIEQLSDVYDMYKMVLTRVRDANKSFLNEKKEAISALASRVVGEVRVAGGEHKMRVAMLDPVRKFLWNNLKPVYAFAHMGSDTLTEAFNTVRKGEDVWAVDVTEAREYYLDKSKKYGYDSWDFKKKYRFASGSGLEFELTLDQILSLYAYSKREQAHEHLKLGGFVFDSNIETYKEQGSKIIKYKVNTADAHQITPDILANIISNLSDDQKGFVDEMQDYLSTVMGAKGNEITMKMYGVKLFKEKFYFPLKSAKQFMFEQNEVSGEVRIKNSGFTNKVVAHANNPVILSNFMDVWSGHVNDMSMYHAFVLPLEDFNRIFNYNSPKLEGQPPVSVKGTIQNAYSPAAVSYVKQLITDLNGGARSDPATGIINTLMGLFKKGSVFASLSVVVQQPSAVARAAALVDTKYFIGPKVDHKRHKALWDEVKKYAPVAIIKEMGYFDTNMGKSTQDFIQGKEYSGFQEKMKALVTDSGYRDEALSKAPALADEIAWCAIWEAVKREMHDKYSSLDVNSEPFLMLCGSRFTEVITKTQVYDSVLSRSALMRSKDTGMKMATAFMAEPTTSINMIADALLQGKRGNRKYCRAAIGAVVASQILNSILVSFVYAGRDDDEEETYAEKYIGTLSGEILDSLNPAGYIPFIKDIQSIVQGYDVERSDMAVISDLWNAWQSLSKDNVSVYRKVEGFAGSIAQIFGLPVKNIMRDVRGIYQTIDSFVNGEKTTGAGIGYAVKGAITGKDVSNQQQLYEAIVNGDQAHISRVKGRFKDQSAINSAIRNALRENDPRIREAAQAQVNGDPSERVRIARLIMADGFSQDDVVAAINSEINAMTKSETTTSTQKATGIYKASDFATEIANGDYAAANAAKTDIIRTAQKNGKTAEEAEKAFISDAKGALKDLFVAGEISEAKAVSALTDYCGIEEQDAMADVQYWAFKKNYPDVYADDAWFDKYNKDIADYGIDIVVYMNYRNQVKNITGDGKKEKRMDVIHSLPITSAQKDAMYFAEGWAASTLYEAPWH